MLTRKLLLAGCLLVSQPGLSGGIEDEIGGQGLCIEGLNDVIGELRFSSYWKIPSVLCCPCGLENWGRSNEWSTFRDVLLEAHRLYPTLTDDPETGLTVSRDLYNYSREADLPKLDVKEYIRELEEVWNFPAHVCRTFIDHLLTRNPVMLAKRIKAGIDAAALRDERNRYIEILD